MSARWRKVIGDLKERPSRALAVVAAIMVGSTMMTAALGARTILEREVDASFRGSNPAGASLSLDVADRALADRVEQLSGVVAAEPRRGSCEPAPRSRPASGGRSGSSPSTTSRR